MKSAAPTLLLFCMIFASCEKMVPADPYIEMTEFSECKDFSPKSISDYSSSQDCIVYTYFDDSVLNIKHINAGFNCCPGRLMVDVELKEDTIFIFETERENPCDCDCLYDMSYSLFGITPGQYVLSVVEPYVRPEYERMIFTIDLKKNPSGEYCIERNFYPWGY